MPRQIKPRAGAKQEWGIAGDGIGDLAIYRGIGGEWHIGLSGGGRIDQAWGGSEWYPVLPQYQINRRFGLLP